MLRKCLLLGFVIAVIFALVLNVIQVKDPYFDKQWNLKSSKGIDAVHMWKCIRYEMQERKVAVAVIDTGVDFSNKELSGRKYAINDDCKNSRYCSDNFDSYHGTMCAEIIAANSNGYGIEGIASIRSVKIMSIKALNSNHSIGGGTIKGIIAAIKLADRNGADICNLSFGTYKYSRELYEVMRESKMLFVTAAGNATSYRGINIDKKPYYPASFNLDNIISVTSVDRQGEYYSLANYGCSSVDVAAPGVDIPIVQENGKIGLVTGTSFAVPHVTGIASIMYTQDKELNAANCRRIIMKSVNKDGTLSSKCKSGGRIDGYNALRTLKNQRNN